MSIDPVTLSAIVSSGKILYDFIERVREGKVIDAQEEATSLLARHDIACAKSDLLRLAAELELESEE